MAIWKGKIRKRKSGKGIPATKASGKESCQESRCNSEPTFGEKVRIQLEGKTSYYSP